MLELLFIRHGQTEWNAIRRVMGRRPIPLNERGRGQAERLAEYLSNAGLRGIVSSPVERAKETAGIIASRHDGLEVELDDGITEVGCGEWEGLDVDEMQRRYAESWRNYVEEPETMAYPGGESNREIIARVGASVDAIAERFKDGRVAIVSHADIIKMALLHLLKLGLGNLARFSIGNCSISLVRYYPGMGPRLYILNYLTTFEKDV